MRRALNTIPRDEYNELLYEALVRMNRRLRAMSDEESSKARTAENKGDYEKAEKHLFNSLAFNIYEKAFYQFHKEVKVKKEESK